jgi:uroporphyrinogen-III synthase
VAELPLAGRRVVVTRPREHSAYLVGALQRIGADAAIVPLIAIEPTEDSEYVRLVESGAHDWIVFTSANAVRAVGAALPHARARFAAVGPATAAALHDLGLEPAFVPDRFAADEIAIALEPVAGARILLPQSEIAEPLLADLLRARGASVDAVDAYRTVPRQPTQAELATLLSADAITLLSGSAARSLAAVGGGEGALLACIGPKTAEVAREVGLRVGLVADEATSQGIIRALVEHYGESR